MASYKITRYMLFETTLELGVVRLLWGGGVYVIMEKQENNPVIA